MENGFIVHISDDIYMLQCEHGYIVRKLIRKDNDILYLISDDLEILRFSRMSDMPMRFIVDPPYEIEHYSNDN